MLFYLVTDFVTDSPKITFSFSKYVNDFLRIDIGIILENYY